MCYDLYPHAQAADVILPQILSSFCYLPQKLLCEAGRLFAPTSFSYVFYLISSGVHEGRKDTKDMPRMSPGKNTLALFGRRRILIYSTIFRHQCHNNTDI
jgi:hypothetical protein